jgi:outer membrane immunogenic protein
VAAPVHSWTGFYVGGNVGGGIARNHANEVEFLVGFPPASSSEQFTLAPIGWLGGGQIGYNWQQPGSPFVWGVEADWQGTRQKDSLCLRICGPFGGIGQDISFRVEQRLDWFATARLRGGYAANGWLWYLTGGAAWGRVREDATFFDLLGGFTLVPDTRGAGSVQSTRSGWTVGAGVETMLWAGWSAKLEYLYLNLGSTAYGFTSVGPAGQLVDAQTITMPMNDHIIRAGLNYRFGTTGNSLVPVYNKVPPVYATPAAHAWTGLYVGGNIGGSGARNHSSELQLLSGLPLANSSEQFTLAPAGWLGGGQIGYNWQQPGSPWVLGVEADFQWTNQQDSVCLQACGPGGFQGENIFVRVEQRLNWFYTARVRGGHARNGWLWYVTGGAAWGRVTESDAQLDLLGGFTFPAGPTAGAATFSNIRSGWTVGAGVEAMLWAGWSAKLEYLYVDLGSTTHAFTLFSPAGVPIGSETISSQMKDNVIRAGLNYKFGSYSAPAVIK